MTERTALPYPPPFQDIRTLSEHICASETTIEAWVKLGLLPAPRKVGGKRLWQWTAVERHLAASDEAGAASLEEIGERMKNATRAAAREHN